MGTFGDYCRSNPSAVKTLRRIAAAASQTHTDEIFDYLIDQLSDKKKWESIDDWKAFAKVAAKRYAWKLHRRATESETAAPKEPDDKNKSDKITRRKKPKVTTKDPDILLRLADAQDVHARTSDQVLITAEDLELQEKEKEYVRKEIEKLKREKEEYEESEKKKPKGKKLEGEKKKIMDWDVLDAFANTSSGREAARKLGIPEATFRKRLKEIIERIQPPPGLGRGHS